MQQWSIRTTCMWFELDTIIMHAVQAWLVEDNQLVLAQSTASLTQCKACELGHYLLQPTATDVVSASSNTSRIDSLKRVLATVWSIYVTVNHLVDTAKHASSVGPSNVYSYLLVSAAVCSSLLILHVINTTFPTSCWGTLSLIGDSNQ